VDDVIIEHSEIKLNIVEKTDLSSVDGPAFIHGKVGRNTLPDTKVKSFTDIISSEGGADVDIAFLKFCYVDVRRDSDPQTIFSDYQLAITDLQERYPETIIVHVTVPIESAPVGVKGVLKEKIKTVLRRPGVVEDNSVRERYNELLRTSYAGEEPIFDIARYESISPEGDMSYRTSASGKVYLMDARYTDDGGHLNKLGRRVVAEQLLMTLAEVANDQGLAAVPSQE